MSPGGRGGSVEREVGMGREGRIGRRKGAQGVCQPRWLIAVWVRILCSGEGSRGGGGAWCECGEWCAADAL